MPDTTMTAPDLAGKTVFAVDLLSRAYQLFHALPEMTAPDGRPVSVVFGLTRDLLDILEKPQARLPVLRDGCGRARPFGMRGSRPTRPIGPRCRPTWCRRSRSSAGCSR